MAERFQGTAQKFSTAFSAGSRLSDAAIDPF
jgi:hypothetical protein